GANALVFVAWGNRYPIMLRGAGLYQSGQQLTMFDPVMGNSRTRPPRGRSQIRLRRNKSPGLRRGSLGIGCRAKLTTGSRRNIPSLARKRLGSQGQAAALGSKSRGARQIEAISISGTARSACPES